MPQASGIATQVRASKEGTWSVPPGTGTGRLVRRYSCDLAVSKESLKSKELLPHYQLADLRHGLMSSKGTLQAEPSPGAHSDLLASAIRKAFVGGATTGALTNITATASAPHFVRAAGSFLIDGFKVGDVVRWTGWTTGGTPNNGRNYWIYALTATQMSVLDIGSATGTVAAKTSGDSVTCTVVGKKSWIPESGHTDESWAIERFFADITQGELFLGVKMGGFTLKYAAGNMADLSIPLLGGGYLNAAAQYYTSPTAVSTTNVLSGSAGGMMLAGGAVAYLRELTISLNNNLSTVPVIGSDFVRGITQGTQDVTGSGVAYFEDATMRDYFLNETEVSVGYCGITSRATNADFINCFMPRAKLMDVSKPDSAGVLTIPFQFQALYNGAGGAGVASERTSLSMQDSLAA